MHLELHSKSKRQNSRISSLCLVSSRLVNRKHHQEKFLGIFRWCSPAALQDRPEVRPAKAAAAISAHFLCALGVVQSVHLYLWDLYGLPLAVQEIASPISLTAVASRCNFSIRLWVAGFTQQAECFHFIPKFALPMEHLRQNLLSFYI